MSQYELVERSNDGTRTITGRADGLMVFIRLAAAAADNQLVIDGGFVAVHTSDPLHPSVRDPKWNSYSYEVRGGGGLGGFTFGHVHPRRARKTEVINEFSRLYVFEFNDLAARAGWFSDDDWSASYQHPIYNGGGDRSRYLFHRVSLGEVKDRWAHAVVEDRTDAGADGLTVVTPFVRRSVLRTLLASATGGPRQPGYMPRLTVTTGHGSDTTANQTWSHFPGASGALPGDVTGFAMLAYGGFKSIRLAELPAWQAAATGEWDATAVLQKLSEAAARYVRTPRDLENVAAHDMNSVVTPTAKNLPVEVLHLTGLASPHHVFPETD